MGENGERGAHRAGWAGVSGSGRRQSGGCVLQTRVKKQARGRPGLPEEGRALEGAGRVRNTGDYCGRLPSQQTHTHTAHVLQDRHQPGHWGHRKPSPQPEDAYDTRVRLCRPPAGHLQWLLIVRQRLALPLWPGSPQAPSPASPLPCFPALFSCSGNINLISAPRPRRRPPRGLCTCHSSCW